MLWPVTAIFRIIPIDRAGWILHRIVGVGVKSVIRVIAAELPDVAKHIVQSERIWTFAADRNGLRFRIARLVKIIRRPSHFVDVGVGPPLAADKNGIRDAAPCRKFPLRLRRQIERQSSAGLCLQKTANAVGGGRARYGIIVRVPCFAAETPPLKSRDRLVQVIHKHSLVREIIPARTVNLLVLRLRHGEHADVVV